MLITFPEEIPDFNPNWNFEPILVPRTDGTRDQVQFSNLTLARGASRPVS